ncbi:hypothetical protein RJ641_034733 [Dillenia turbinata]|uniref:Uncharacterized protein n=1 Tax=Dillenia turbinata TaxID=194707 RepID=A0AAN8ZHV5_9MAGN
MYQLNYSVFGKASEPFAMVSWETLVVTVNNSAPNGKLTLGMVKDNMFNEKARQKDMESISSQALVTENRGRIMNGDQNSRGRSKSKKRSKSREDEKCKSISDDNNTVVVGSDEGIESLVCTPSDYNHVGDPLSE